MLVRITNCLSSCANLAPEQTCMCKLLRYSSFSSNVSADALSITKQIQYIAIEDFTSNINYIKKRKQLNDSNLPLSTK